MILQDVPIGSQVRLYVEEYGSPPLPHKSSHTVDAWVVAAVGTHKSTFADRLLLAWKKDEKPTTVSGWSVNQKGVDTLLPPDPSILKGYTHAYWTERNALVDRILQSDHASTITHTGMYCRGCRNWSPYASPNRPSGNFVCWSCRQGFVPGDW